MGLQLTPDQRAFYEAVDRILWEDWDPIGVNDAPEARNEYSTYLPQVFSLAIESQSSAPIFNYFELVTADNMGLDSNTAHNQAIADKIFDLRKSVSL